MSLDDELRRQLQAKAAGVRAEPDLAELTRRIRAREARTARNEKLALLAAAVLLAGSLGGLAGALVTAPRASGPAISQVAGRESLAAPASRQAPKPANGPALPAKDAPRTVVSEVVAGGISLRATAQPLGTPVAIDGAWGSFSYCSAGELVTSTIASGSELGSGTGVSGLVPLGTGGLEVVSSGTVPMPSGSEIWWVTFAVGSSVVRVAAEGSDGGIVAVQPSQGVAVVAGESAVAEESVSAVAETASGQSVASLQVLLGSGPKVVGAPVATRSGSAPACHVVALPVVPSSASASQPATPPLAAASVVGAYEQAFLPDPWQGFASNLAAVADANQLGAGVEDSGAGGDVVPAVASNGGDSRGLPILVRQVTFLSAGKAEVVYRLGDGIWRVGIAVLGDGGTWRVGLSSYCSAVRGDADLVVPSSVQAACAAALAAAGNAG